MALSEKLYSTKTHFLLELIQNADDNSYSKGVEPELTFQLTNIELEGKKQKCLCIQNNEIGFSEKNLNALFQVCASSKKKKDGFIGEKGIGFKSVFSISDCPYIFSAGYQFKLPKSCNMGNGVSLGYIVPIWVEKPPKIIMSNTNIILPIKTDSISIEELSKELFQISPELILFLKKLNKITIIQDDELETKKYIIFREFDKKHEIVTLSSEEWLNNCLKGRISTSFLYKMKEVNKPTNINIEEREDVFTREISIAIPLDNEDYGGKLFAYLPVRDGTGLPFLINADFILTSSREKVADNEWNDWLWNEIPFFFAEIIKDVMCDDTYSLEVKKIVFSHIPIKASERQFQQLIDSIYDELKQLKCVLAYQSNNAEFPEKCHLTSQKVKGILSALKWFPSESSPVLLSDALESYTSILKKLDVPKLSRSEVLGLFEQEFIEKLSEQDLISFYMFLKSEDYTDLDNYPWIPVTDGIGTKLMISSNNDEAIYYPLDSQNELSGLIGKEFVKLFFLRESLYITIRNSTQSKEILNFLRDTWHVYPFNFSNYCIDLKNILVADFRGSDKQFIEISEYILKGNEIPTFFVTNKGRIESSGKLLVVSPEYEEFGWGAIWNSSSSRERIIYLKGYSKDYQQQLLSKHIIEAFPLFEVEKNRNPSSYAATKVYKEAMNSAQLFRKDETEVIYPIIPSNILSKITDTIIKSLINFWTYALKNYDNYKDVDNHNKFIYLGLKCEAIYYNKFYYKTTGNSDLLELLMSTEWLPTTKGLRKPKEVWYRTEFIEEWFGDDVPYLNISLPSEVITLFEINDQLTLDHIYSYLVGLSREETQIENKLAEKIYKICDMLDLGTRLKHLQEEEEDARIIFVPNSNKLWYNVNECLWNDESILLGEAFQYLSKYYPERKSFFISLGVSEKADADTYLKCWEYEQKNGSKLSKAKMSSLYLKVFDCYIDIPIAKWRDFANNAKLITSDGNFAEPDTFVFNDNASLTKIFEDASEINIAYIPLQSKASLQKWAKFYDEFFVKTISQCVSSKLVSNQIDKSVLELNYSTLTPQCIAMIATWLHEKYPNDYNAITAPGSVMTQLESFIVYNTKNPIEIEYKLCTRNIHITRRSSATVYMDINAHEIICNYNDEDWKMIFATELAQYISKDRKLHGFDEFIELVLCNTNIRRIEEKNWIIPLEFEHLIQSHHKIEDDKEAESEIIEDVKSTEKQQSSIASTSQKDSPESQTHNKTSQDNDRGSNNEELDDNIDKHNQSNIVKAPSNSKNDHTISKEDDSLLDKTSPSTPSLATKENKRPIGTVSDTLVHQDGTTTEGTKEVSQTGTRDTQEKPTISKNNLSTGTRQDREDQDDKDKSVHNKSDAVHNHDQSRPANSHKQVSNDTFVEQDDVPWGQPNYADALNRKFSRQGTEIDNYSNQEEFDDEPLTPEMRKRRQDKVAKEIREMHSNSIIRNNAHSRQNNDAASRQNNTKVFSTDKPENTSEKLSEFIDLSGNPLTLEEEKLLRHFSSGGDFKSNMRIMLAVAHKNNPMVRADLEQHYHGRCQICHHTWQMANGKPFWIATYLLPHSKGGVPHSSNAICLCAEHFVQWLHGSLTTQIDFTDIIKSIPEDEIHPQIHFELAGKPVILTYNQRHFCDLKTLLQINNENIDSEQTSNRSEEKTVQFTSTNKAGVQTPPQTDASPKRKNQTFSSFEELSKFYKDK